MKTGLMIAAALMASPVAAQTATERSRFEPGPCAVQVAADERIDCGMLVVPENRARPDSRLIRLPVVIFRSHSATPANDPVLFLPGGPGASALEGQRSGRGNPFLEERDQIRLEPRGGKLTETPLECPAINALKGELAGGALSGAEADTQLTQAATACRAELTARGVDLNGYTSAETADDIEALRVALGYDKLNLYALSYGTRLALTVARRHPGSVRSMVLDSVLPPEVGYDETASANIWRALNAVFDGCAAEPACAAAWPRVREDFRTLVAGENGPRVVDAVTGALQDPRRIALIPRAVGSAVAGRPEELSEWMARDSGPSSFTWGLRLSVWCAEEAPFEATGRVEDQTASHWGLAGTDARTASIAMCRSWNVAAADPVENTPVVADIPTLIFAGEFDPTTPPDWGRRLLVQMSKATFVEMPGLSHGASFNRCGGLMAVAFIRDPDTTPDVVCANRMRGADFALSAGPP
ncbi:MAG: alpha/beta fold hydrolase [Brevundimonas sp.]|nr:MAG: alpha/beta fold hydrolase [Brevundimonas sp.]